MLSDCPKHGQELYVYGIILFVYHLFIETKRVNLVTVFPRADTVSLTLKTPQKIESVTAGIVDTT